MSQCGLCFPKTVPSTMKLSDMHSTQPGIMSGAVGLDASLSMTTEVSSRGVIVVVGKVKIKVDSGVDGLPYFIPALIVSLL